MAVAPGLNKITYVYIDVNTNFGVVPGILVADIDAINNQFYNILSCMIGECDYEPTLGALLDLYLFEQNTESTAATIQSLLYTAINKWLGSRIYVTPQNIAFTVNSADRYVSVAINYTYLLSNTSVQVTMNLPIAH